MLKAWQSEESMNKSRKLFTVILLAVLTFLGGSSIYAAEKQDDGIIVTLTADKKEYKEGEKISVDLSIKNTNEYSVTLTNAMNVIPEGFVLDNDTTNTLNKTELEIGASTNLRTEFKENTTQVIKPVESDNTNNDTGALTGDTSNIKVLVSVVGISALLLFLIVTIRYRNFRKSLTVLLSFGIISLSLLSNVKAEESTEELIVEEEISYGGKKLKLSSKVSYENNNNTSDPKDPVVYKEGIEETYVEYDLDEENMKVTILDNKVTSDWKIGEIHVLKNILNPVDDIAIEIKSITQEDNETTVIVYKTPDLAKVIESIDYAGAEMQEGVITPAEGVTFLDNTKDTRRSRLNLISPFGLDIEESGKFNLFAKHDFSMEKGGIEFNGELNIKRINYDFRLNAELFSIDFEKGYLTLDSSLKLGVNVKNDFGGEKKMKIASFEAPIGYGFFAVGEIYCYFSATGELVLDYTINATCGFDYEDGNFKGVWKLDSKLNEAKADLSLKVGSTAEPKLSFLKIGIVGGEFNFGRNYELKLDEISIDPIEFCLDASYHNFASVSSVLLPGTWDKKFTAELFGGSNIPTKELMHIEEGKTVAECTRKFGSLEGTVRKQEGEAEEPLYLADVSLLKDGKILYSSKTDAEGNFYFGKEIEKGTYDIVVKSNRYEPYNGKVKIIGNKKNKIEKPIVLKPYGELIVISGFIFDSKTLLPIPDATISVEGISEISTKTDSEGKYVLGVPVGKRKIIASAPTYMANSYIEEFSENLSGINIGLTKEKNYDYEVVRIGAGESYQFDFNTSKRIFVRFTEDTEYSSYSFSHSAYEDEYAVYHASKEALDEYYTKVDENSHLEIKIFSGSAIVFASDGGFESDPDSDLSKYCKITNLNGIDPFINLTLNAGDTKTFDNQVDNQKSDSSKLYLVSNGPVSLTEEVTDYYWQTHFGWELREERYELNGIAKFWRPIGQLVKNKISITSGELLIYYYRLDEFAIY